MCPYMSSVSADLTFLLRLYHKYSIRKRRELVSALSSPAFSAEYRARRPAISPSLRWTLRMCTLRLPLDAVRCWQWGHTYSLSFLCTCTMCCLTHQRWADLKRRALRSRTNINHVQRLT